MDILIETLIALLGKDVAKICFDYCERKEVFSREYNVYGGCIYGITTSSQGEIYVIRQYRYPFHIEVQRLEENFAQISSKDSYPASNEIYVTNFYGHHIQVFSREGKFIRKWGSRGNGDGEFNGPYGIAISKCNEIYVTDYMNDRIQVFTPEGKFLRKWTLYGKRGEKIQFPFGIAVSACNEVYVTSFTRNCVYVYTSEGEFLREWEIEHSKGLSEIVVSSCSEIYVADRRSHCIYVFTSEGRLLRCLKHPRFNFPGSITIVRKSFLREEIYITNTNSGYIQVFGYDLA